MQGAYLGILVMMAIAALICAAMVTLSWLLGPKKRISYKDSPYECGMVPTGSAKESFSVKFYLVAMLFILFDVEAVFLYPWVVVFRELRMVALIEMGIFVALILSGFFYIWRKGVLDWSKASSPRTVPGRAATLEEAGSRR